MRLVRGRKYGLIGRNGIGKTTLINSISKKEFDKFPKNVHVLQIEQEVDGDDISVLDHVLSCDKERNALLKEKADIEASD